MPGGSAGRAIRPGATPRQAGDARAAGDGDMSTAWVVPGELRGDEVLEILFDRSLRLAWPRAPLRRDSAFSTVLRVEGLGADGEWSRLARLDGPHVLQLVDQLLVHPGEASLGLRPDRPRGQRAEASCPAEGAWGFDGWVIPELEVRVPLSRSISAGSAARRAAKQGGVRQGQDQGEVEPRGHARGGQRARAGSSTA